MRHIRIQVPPGEAMTIDVPGLTSILIDTTGRVIAVDNVSSPPFGEEGGLLGGDAEWRVFDLRDGTYGDFHRLKPAGECNDADCARDEHIWIEMP